STSSPPLQDLECNLAQGITNRPETCRGVDPYSRDIAPLIMLPAEENQATFLTGAQVFARHCNRDALGFDDPEPAITRIMWIASPRRQARQIQQCTHRRGEVAVADGHRSI